MTKEPNSDTAFHNDGVMGLALDNTGGLVDYVSALKYSGVIQDRTIGMFISDDAKTQSVLTIGGYDESLISGDIYW